MSEDIHRCCWDEEIRFDREQRQVVDFKDLRSDRDGAWIVEDMVNYWSCRLLDGMRFDGLIDRP